MLGWLRQGCGRHGKMLKAPAVSTLAISFLTYRFPQGPLVSLALGNINLHFLRLGREELGDSCRASHPNLAETESFQRTRLSPRPNVRSTKISDEHKLHKDGNLQFAEGWSSS